MDELKGYASAKTNGYHTLSHGHPEIQAPGIEVTTGPLGQGIANAVGLAIASKNLAAKFNKPDCEILNSRIWCMTGDGCLMEGVAMEGMCTVLSSVTSCSSPSSNLSCRTFVPGQLDFNLRQQQRNL